jgi:hypothetical protein
MYAKIHYLNFKYKCFKNNKFLTSKKKSIKMKDNRDKTLKSIYTTLFSQKFSPDGNELAICSNFGEISLFK